MANVKKKTAQRKAGRPSNQWKQIEGNFDFGIPANAKTGKSNSLNYDVRIQRTIKDTYKHGIISLGKFFLIRKKSFKTMSIGVSTTAKPVLVLAMDNDYYEDRVPVRTVKDDVKQNVWNYPLVDYIVHAMKIPDADKKKSITLYFEVEQEPAKNIFILKQIKL